MAAPGLMASVWTITRRAALFLGRGTPGGGSPMPGDCPRRTGLPAALAGPNLLQAPTLPLVQGQVAADGDRGCDDDDRDCGPRWQNGQEDQPENDPGDPDLHARCHDDSIRPGYPTQPRPAYPLTVEDRRADLVAGRR